MYHEFLKPRENDLYVHFRSNNHILNQLYDYTICGGHCLHDRGFSAETACTQEITTPTV